MPIPFAMISCVDLRNAPKYPNNKHTEPNSLPRDRPKYRTGDLLPCSRPPSKVFDRCAAHHNRFFIFGASNPHYPLPMKTLLLNLVLPCILLFAAFQSLHGQSAEMDPYLQEALQGAGDDTLVDVIVYLR